MKLYMNVRPLFFRGTCLLLSFVEQGNKRALERLSAGQEAVESSLQARLLEALNSEVCMVQPSYIATYKH